MIDTDAAESNRPLLSVITVNMNNAAGLARTLASATTQQFQGFEQIVVDGGSTDGSVELLSGSGYRVDQWVSEPDRGIYEAMNKGIRLARGEYLLFLNSGDHLCNDGALAAAAPHLGSADLHGFALEIRQPLADGGFDSLVRPFPRSLPFSFFCRNAPPHPSTVIRASLFADHGLYDETLRICSDWKFFLLCVCRHNCSYRAHAEVLSVFYADGVSSRPEQAAVIRRERQAVLASEFPAFVEDVDALVEAAHNAELLRQLRHSRRVGLLQRLRVLWRF